MNAKEAFSLLGAGLVAGFVFSSVAFLSSNLESKQDDKPTGTAEPTVITRTETKTVTETVEVIALPESCAKAMDLANRIQTNVSSVSATMGAQLDIASKARMAINGSEYLSLGQVMLDQRELEQTVRDEYTALAEEYALLSDMTEQCNQAIDSAQ